MSFFTLDNYIINKDHISCVCVDYDSSSNQILILLNGQSTPLRIYNDGILFQKLCQFLNAKPLKDMIDHKDMENSFQNIYTTISTNE